MSFLRRLLFELKYFQNPPWDTGITPPELMRFIAAHSPGRALDLGCGTGTNVITLAQHGWQTTGVDFSPTAIRAAHKKVAQQGLNVTLLVQDVSKLQTIPGPFDLILDIGCYHSLPQPERRAYQANLLRLLSPGGAYLLYTFFDYNGNKTGIGISDTDIDFLAQNLTIVSKELGVDRGQRPSAWFVCQKP